MKSLLLILLTFFVVHPATCTHQQLPNRQPNIILVFIDDMGWGDLSCFGNDRANTPVIDQLAAEGIAFEQFYVNAPICSPSRVAISTGQYPQRWGIRSYLATREKNAERNMASWLDPKAPMLARMLKESGYATGHFGKWHMGGQRDVRDAPAITEYGFDVSLTNFEGMGAKLLPLTEKPGGEKSRIWGNARLLGGPVIWMQRSEITTGFVEAAIAFIWNAKKDNTPFYINLWPDDVHTPLFPSVENWSDDNQERYIAVLEEMDRQLKLLFDYIRNDDELRDNTLILLCSDNGHVEAIGNGGPFKGGKTNLYEGGIRSPLIAWGPGILSNESVGLRNNTSTFAAMDLVPTLLHLTGTKVPQGISFDGEDMLDALMGLDLSSRESPLFFSRPFEMKNSSRHGKLPDLAVRHEKWKLLCDYDGSNIQLYDIMADPGESSNLKDVHPEIAFRLMSMVTDWYRKVKP